MSDNILDTFLVKLSFKVDDHSQSKFDAALISVGRKIAALGAAAAAAATAAEISVKKISESLGDLWYSAQAAQSSAQDMNAFAYAVQQSGGKAGEGAAELKSFTDFVKSTAGQGAFANWFKVPFDVAHPVNSLMVAIDQLSEQFAKGGAAQANAIQRAKMLGINPDELNPDRVAKMHKAYDSKLKETGWVDDLSKKSVKLNEDFSAVTTHLKEIAEQASGPLMDAMSGLLKKTDSWLLKNKDWLVATSKTLAQGIVDGVKVYWHAYADIVNDLDLMSDKVMEVMGDEKGDKGVRAMAAAFKALQPLAKRIGDAIHNALEWAMKPLQAIIDALRSMGLISPAQASTGGSAGDPGGSTGGGGGGGSGGAGGFESGEATESGGHGSERRGKFGHRGVAGGGGTEPDAGNQAPNYSEMSVKDAWQKYAPSSENNTDAYIKTITGAAGILATTKLKDLTLAQRKKFLAAVQKVEGWFAGSRSFKNKNPGNIQYGAFAKAHGATGSDGRFAIFPDEATGKSALNSLLFEPRNPGGKKGGHFANMPLPPADFRKTLDSIKASKPLTPWQQSSNESHDHRVVNSKVAVNVKGGFPVDKTERPLERPKLATFIRNTTAFAS